MTKRVAIIEKDKCNPIGCGNFLCVRLCPVNKAGTECIVESDDGKALIYENTCIGCGICPVRCPFGAISIVNLPEKLTAEPIHRYGINSFELFGLPLVKPGVVLGIIGRNGIGKSTALSLLSGFVTPNLGNYAEEGSTAAVVAAYSNSHIGEYFRHLSSAKVAYKPQRVERLTTHYQGTMRELLTRSDERGVAFSLVDRFGLTPLLDRDIAQLSGGELQLLAIIACVSRKADVYYFDEPTSFCDITHRVAVARLLRELDAAVLVVEHDLAILDYISDEVQIVYGEPGCYGIFSQPKSVRRGINAYLDGYLDDDNVRFRSSALNFMVTGGERVVSSLVAFSYPALKKSLGSFSLSVAAGDVHKGEVLAIVGANGLGKSTFMKLLAGVVASDSGEVPVISYLYKPQYLTQDDEVTVYEYLFSRIGSALETSWYKSAVLERLGLTSLLQNAFAHLSGGELQKVHVAACLAGEMDVLLLDEPSAFVDVEDRLVLASVIRDFVAQKDICAIVIDHDISFIDVVSDRLLVFSGQPGVRGLVSSPCGKVDGMNALLCSLDITYRRDKDTGRPRINKPGSQLDREQRAHGTFYYVS